MRNSSGLTQAIAEYLNQADDQLAIRFAKVFDQPAEPVTLIVGVRTSLT
jgi:hypothetical protein